MNTATHTDDQIKAAAEILVRNNYEQAEYIINQMQETSKRLGELQKSSDLILKQLYSNEYEKQVAHKVEVLYNTLDPDGEFWYENPTEIKKLFENIINGIVGADVTDDKTFIENIHTLLDFLKIRKLSKIKKKKKTK